MSIPMTQACPSCEADMELLTADDDGEIFVYECPECGYQVEHRVADEGPADEDQDPGLPPAIDEDELESLEPDDES